MAGQPLEGMVRAFESQLHGLIQVTDEGHRYFFEDEVFLT